VQYNVYLSVAEKYVRNDNKDLLPPAPPPNKPFCMEHQSFFPCVEASHHTATYSLPYIKSHTKSPHLPPPPISLTTHLPTPNPSDYIRPSHNPDSPLMHAIPCAPPPLHLHSAPPASPSFHHPTMQVTYTATTPAPPISIATITAQVHIHKCTRSILKRDREFQNTALRCNAYVSSHGRWVPSRSGEWNFDSSAEPLQRMLP
jgi:hypothetical protein